jgi:hypothetical protein
LNDDLPDQALAQLGYVLCGIKIRIDFQSASAASAIRQDGW